MEEDTSAGAASSAELSSCTAGKAFATHLPVVSCPKESVYLWARMESASGAQLFWLDVGEAGGQPQYRCRAQLGKRQGPLSPMQVPHHDNQMLCCGLEGCSRGLRWGIRHRAGGSGRHRPRRRHRGAGGLTAVQEGGESLVQPVHAGWTLQGCLGGSVGRWSGADGRTINAGSINGAHMRCHAHTLRSGCEGSTGAACPSPLFARLLGPAVELLRSAAGAQSPPRGLHRPLPSPVSTEGGHARALPSPAALSPLRQAEQPSSRWLPR